MRRFDGAPILIVNYNACLQLMLRWLTRSLVFLARQSRKPKSSPLVEPEDADQEQQRDNSLRSQYQHVKEKYYKLDQLQQPDQDSNLKLDKTFDLIKKMMEKGEFEHNQTQKPKQKIDLLHKLRQMGTPDSILNQHSSVATQQPTQTHQIHHTQQEQSSDILARKQLQRQVEQKISQTKSLTPEQYAKLKELEVKMAQQDILLSKIMETSKQKELKHLNQVEDKPDEFGFTQKQKQLILRQQKIIEALQNKEDPSQQQYTLTRQDLLAMKYSEDIIQKAKDYSNHQLAYFKQLIINENEDTDPERDISQRRKFLNPEDEKRWMLMNQQPQRQNLVQNSYIGKKTEQGLVTLEDTEFYKKKAEKQIKEKEVLDEEDRKIIEEFNKDLGMGNQVSEVFLNDVVFPVEGKLQRAVLMDETSFARQDKKVKSLATRLQKLGLDYQMDDIKAMSKINLFQEKKFLQEEQRFQKYLHKKEKKKNMKKQLKEIHRTQLKDDIDFDKQQQSVLSIKEIKDSSDVEMLEDNYQKINEYMAQKQATTVTETSEEKKSRIHHQKTFKNMRNVIAMYFANGLFNHTHGQLQQIDILDIIPNRTNTVLNVFWQIQKSYLTQKGIIEGIQSYQNMFEAEKKKVQSSLKRQAPYISGKMTQLLRLRYGPEIRFVYDRKTKETEEAIYELKKHIKQIAMVEIEEYTKQGHITSEEKQIQYFQKLLLVAQTKLQDFNSRKQLLSKKYQKREELRQSIVESQLKKKDKPEQPNQPVKRKKRKNPLFEDQDDPILQQSQNKPHRKKHPADKFWDTLQLL